MNTTPSGLQYEDTQVGDGEQATSGRYVRVHYTGGLFEGGRFSETAFQLAPGDSVILGTDGITEAFDPVRRAFGTEVRNVL